MPKAKNTNNKGHMEPDGFTRVTAARPKAAKIIGPSLPEGPANKQGPGESKAREIATAMERKTALLESGGAVRREGVICLVPKLPVGSMEVCYRCGGHGHYAAQCNGPPKKPIGQRQQQQQEQQQQQPWADRLPNPALLRASGEADVGTAAILEEQSKEFAEMSAAFASAPVALAVCPWCGTLVHRPNLNVHLVSHREFARQSLVALEGRARTAVATRFDELAAIVRAEAAHELGRLRAPETSTNEEPDASVAAPVQTTERRRKTSAANEEGAKRNRLEQENVCAATSLSEATGIDRERVKSIADIRHDVPANPMEALIKIFLRGVSAPIPLATSSNESHLSFVCPELLWPSPAAWEHLAVEGCTSNMLSVHVAAAAGDSHVHEYTSTGHIQWKNAHFTFHNGPVDQSKRAEVAIVFFKQTSKSRTESKNWAPIELATIKLQAPRPMGCGKSGDEMEVGETPKEPSPPQQISPQHKRTRNESNAHSAAKPRQQLTDTATRKVACTREGRPQRRRQVPYSRARWQDEFPPCDETPVDVNPFLGTVEVSDIIVGYCAAVGDWNWTFFSAQVTSVAKGDATTSETQTHAVYIRTENRHKQLFHEPFPALGWEYSGLHRAVRKQKEPDEDMSDEPIVFRVQEDFLIEEPSEESTEDEGDVPSHWSYPVSYTHLTLPTTPYV